MTASSKSVGIDGTQVLRPGVYTSANDRAMTPPRGGITRRAIVIAEGRGGVVGAITSVASERDVIRDLVSGPAAQLALTHVKRGVPVDVIRVNKATPAGATLGDVDLTARVYGLAGRALQVERYTNATRADAQDVVIRNTRTNETETYSRLGPAFDVRYAGTGTTPTVTVALVSGVPTVTLTATGATGDTLTLSGDSFADVQGVVDAINNSGAWTARITGDATSASAPLTDLKVASYPVTADVIAVAFGVTATIRALNGSRLVTAAAPTAPTAPVLTGSPLYFSGGSEGPAVTVQDWVDALTVAEKSTGYGLVIGSGDPAVIALASSHAQRMSSLKRRRERLVFAGPALQGTKAALITAALSLTQTQGHERLIITTDQGQDYDLVTGKLVRVSAAHFAADACATYLAGGVEVNITKKATRIPKREFEWSEEEIEAFLEAGVVCVDADPDDGILKWEQGLTSYQLDANVMRRKISGMGIKDYLAQRIRQRLKRFVGGVGDEATIAEIVTEIAGVLNEETRTQKQPRGVLTAGENPQTGAPEPAWKNIEVVMDGFDLEIGRAHV